MVDLIRAGKAPEVIRRRGAEGNLPLPVEEQIEVLTVLAAAPQADMRAIALKTLQSWKSAEVRRVLASPLTAPEVLGFAAEHLVAGREELREILLWNPSLPEATRILLQSPPAPRPASEMAAGKVLSEPRAAFEPPGAIAPQPARDQVPPAAPPKPRTEVAGDEVLANLDAALQQKDAEALENLPGEFEVPPEITKHDDELTKNDRETLIEKVGQMSAVEKIKAALTGNMETRMLLVRDPNKVVARAVLSSPRISDTEMESYAAAKNVSEEVLRLIATNRKYMKTYVVLRALINNPRAPVDITMPRLNRLNDRDLKGVAMNRNVPEALRAMAIKMMKQKEDANKAKLPGRH